MAVIQRAGLAILGAATTMMARRMTTMALHRDDGRPKLPAPVRRADSIRMMLLLAGVAGVMLALGDMLQEQRKQVAERAEAA
jgi:hypothetical protein